MSHHQEILSTGICHNTAAINPTTVSTSSAAGSIHHLIAARTALYSVRWDSCRCAMPMWTSETAVTPRSPAVTIIGTFIVMLRTVNGGCDTTADCTFPEAAGRNWSRCPTVAR